MRSPWFRVVVTAATVVIVLLLSASWRFLDSHGVFATVKAVSPGTCRTIADLEGPGAIAVDATAKIAFIGAAGRTPSGSDGLYAYAYDVAGARPAKLPGTSSGFHPIALSLHRDAYGTTLMAINRRASGDYAVDVFVEKLENGTPQLTEVGAVTGDVLVDPSDLAAVDRTRFYIVNRSTSRTGIGRWLDDAFALPRADVLYFDGAKFTPVAKQLVAPSGVALSEDGRFLFVSENLGRTLLSFERNPFTGQLNNAGSLSIASGLEKLSVGPDGGLWVAAQPKAFAVDAYRRDAAKPAPSQVFRVAMGAGKPQSATLYFSNKGDEIGAASVAAVADGHLFIGSAADHKVLDCTIQ